MSKLARISIGFVITLALLGGLAWANRIELMMSVIGFAIDQRYPTRSQRAGRLGIRPRPGRAGAAGAAAQRRAHPRRRPRLERSHLRRRWRRGRNRPHASHGLDRGRRRELHSGLCRERYLRTFARRLDDRPLRHALRLRVHADAARDDAARGDDVGGRGPTHAPADLWPGWLRRRLRSHGHAARYAAVRDYAGRSCSPNRATTPSTSGSGTWAAPGAWRPRIRASMRVC